MCSVVGVAWFLKRQRAKCFAQVCREIGIILPNIQRQHRTLHIQKYVLPYVLQKGVYVRTGAYRPHPEYSRANSYPWSPFSPRRARPGPGPHTPSRVVVGMWVSGR